MMTMIMIIILTSVIFITGGYSGSSRFFPEVYDPSTGFSCLLDQPMLSPTYDHAQANSTVCGGEYEGGDDCYTWEVILLIN